jgi:hypothetical protein
VERVESRDIGFEHQLGAGRTVGVAWFSEATTNQLATLFGVDDAASDAGHYYVEPVGAVSVNGWRVHVDGRLGPFVHGTVSYADARAVWSDVSAGWLVPRGGAAADLAASTPVHEVSAAVDVDVPRSATAVAIVWRVSDGFTDANPLAASSAMRTRLNLDVRQKLPCQLARGSELNLVFTIHTLLRDPDAGAFYDELLTVRPPTRLTGGLQVRF